MVDPKNIAKYFILRAYQDGRENQMTNMKVQKLLYYTQCLHLALYEEPLFAEDIQAWRYGPVCPPAYHYYSDFEAQQLPIPQQDIINLFTQEIREVLEEVWQYFGVYHAYYLSSMTHLEFPWRKARTGLSSQESSTNPLSLEDMGLLGEEKLLEIEKDHPHYNKILSHVLKEGMKEKSDPKYIQQGEVNEWLRSLLD
ncbi:Panacea domain-containing protein [Crocosphaera sp.]|uniref:Panacea domain-containing protein n=1 Tax=Crocosphaera sp. TaxID=2729996 RepID=UPI003F297BAC|nr:DUF4065 domain-containing protein [Crocosphaera sp.]